VAPAGHITATTRGARIGARGPCRRSPRGRGASAARPAACHPRAASIRSRPGVASTTPARWCYNDHVRNQYVYTNLGRYPHPDTSCTPHAMRAASCKTSHKTSCNTTATAKQTKSTSCTPHASGNVNAVVHDQPHDPRNHVQLVLRGNVGRRHSDEQYQLHAARMRQLAHRPTRYAAPHPPPRPAPRPPQPRNH